MSLVQSSTGLHGALCKPTRQTPAHPGSTGAKMWTPRALGSLPWNPSSAHHPGCLSDRQVLGSNGPGSDSRIFLTHCAPPLPPTTKPQASPYSLWASVSLLRNGVTLRTT